MKALRIADYGAALQEDDTAAPTVGPGQVLVETHFTSLNGVDPGRAFGFLRQIFPLQFPWIPGGDVAGRVAAIGDGVTGFRVGEEVFGYTRAGGAYAEFTIVEANSLAPRPATISAEQAAAIALVGQTATQMLQLAKVGAGNTLLILGGAGGVGTLALQLARNAGVHVTTTARQSQAAGLQHLGAERVVNYTQESLESLPQFDAVLNLVGGDTIASSYGRVRPGGVAVTANRPPDFEEAKRLGIEGAFVETDVTSEGLDTFARLVVNGAIVPQIASVETLWSPATLWEDRRTDKLGKVVFRVQS